MLCINRGIFILYNNKCFVKVKRKNTRRKWRRNHFVNPRVVVVVEISNNRASGVWEFEGLLGASVATLRAAPSDGWGIQSRQWERKGQQQPDSPLYPISDWTNKNPPWIQNPARSRIPPRRQLEWLSDSTSPSVISVFWENNKPGVWRASYWRDPVE